MEVRRREERGTSMDYVLRKQAKTVGGKVKQWHFMQLIPSYVLGPDPVNVFIRGTRRANSRSLQ